MLCDCELCSKKRREESNKALQEWKSGVRNIVIEHWDWECGDGCCNDYGTSVYINNLKLIHANGENVERVLDSVLEFLGYEHVNIVEKYDDDDDDED